MNLGRQKAFLKRNHASAEGGLAIFANQGLMPAIFEPMQEFKIIECPRDAMQGWKDFIPTDKKISYINQLLRVGFHTIDFGSFVSPKAIPQMADTREVIAGLDLRETNTRLLAIVANTRGAMEAAEFGQIHYLGFPFSISPTFQQRNTNSTMEESFERVKQIQSVGSESKKQLVVYLSMGFGNPYGDPYDEGILLEWSGKMADAGISIISLADTVGLATPAQVEAALLTLVPQYPHVEFGVHLHSSPQNLLPKLDAAVHAGCRRFDGALKGIGGCPMAQDDLVGNMNTEIMLDHLAKTQDLAIDRKALEKSLQMAAEIFS